MRLTGVFLLLSLAIVCEGGDSMTVDRKTKQGIVTGTITSLSQVFYGIPYAAPAERWTSPSEPLMYTGVLDASSPKPQCYQNPCITANPIGACISDRSEDCLYLNIFVPLGTEPGDKKSVIVYLHGGGFTYNSGAGNVFNGEKIAELGDVIVVTINYRLGFFSFLVTGTSPGDITGNYALQDQRKALEWVQKNIKFFGGTKKKVTLVGQSAGAVSAAIHLISGKADNLFKNVIIESLPTTTPLVPLDIAISSSETVATFLGCSLSDITCLRAKTAEEILTAQNAFEANAAINGFPDSLTRRFFPILPTIDGDEVPLGIVDAFLSNQFSQKSVIWGSTTQEALLYVFSGFSSPVNYLDYLGLISLLEPSLSISILLRYPGSLTGDNRRTMSQLTTDYIFTCPNRLLARRTNVFKRSYIYLFDNVFSIPGLWGDITICDVKPCHGVNVPYMFQSARIPPLVFSDKERALSDKIICHYSNFAKTGNVNKPVTCSGRKWPRLPKGDATEKAMLFNEDGSEVVTGYRKSFCNFWDTADYKARK